MAINYFRWLVAWVDLYVVPSMVIASANSEQPISTGVKLLRNSRRIDHEKDVWTIS